MQLLNVGELRQILSAARRKEKKDTVLFIDEIHRFNKSQQDLLLPDVEEGNIRLIGTTTYNPGFYVNALFLVAAICSASNPTRWTTWLKPSSWLSRILKEAWVTGHSAAKEPCEDWLNERWDYKPSFQCFEVVALGLDVGKTIDEGDIAVFANERQIRYDADEDNHYDTISAFIKHRGRIPMQLLAGQDAAGRGPAFYRSKAYNLRLRRCWPSGCPCLAVGDRDSTSLRIGAAGMRN